MTDTKSVSAMNKTELVAHIATLTNQAANSGQYPDPSLTVVQRLIEIGREVGPMDKAEMKNVNYKAFAIDDVYSKLRPLFSKWEVLIVPKMRSVVLDYVPRHEKSPALDAHVILDYEFHAPDGSSLTMTFGADGRDYGDKSTNKAVQQAFKYGLIQMFMISTGEVDPDDIPVDETPHSTPAKHARTVQSTNVNGPPPTKKEQLLRRVKDHAWILNAGIVDENYRIEETKLLVDQELAAYGRNPDDEADAQAIMANMDAIFEDREAAEQPDAELHVDDGSGDGA